MSGYLDAWIGTSIRKDSKHPPVVRDRNTDKEWEAQPYSDNLEFLVPAEGVEVVLFASPDGELYNKVEPYTGSHTVWCGIVPDYSMPEVHLFPVR